MGSSDHGDNPAALAHTRRLGPRVHGSHHDIVALIVPGGPSVEAQCDFIGLRVPDRVGPLRSIENSRGSHVQTAVAGPKGLPEGHAPGRAHPTVGVGIRKT
jgi:hypothetical protein